MKPLEILGLSKWYGRARGIEDLSFALEPGEIFGYLGPNGSGKTTTIRCVMGLLRSSAGEMRIFGERVRPGRGVGHARVGYLPGDFRVWPGLTARRALRLLAGIGEAPEADSRREVLAERLGLSLDRPSRALSKGNRQKIGVIYAMQHSPDLLILDEPTGGLDPLVRQTVLDLIREAAAAGATVLLSSHDLAEVAMACGRAAILRQGRMVELAPISRIVGESERQLKVWFAAGQAIASPPLELLEGVRVVERTGNVIHFAYRGTPGELLKWVSQFPVDRISTPEASLEEAFMQYYRDAPDGAPEGRNSL